MPWIGAARAFKGAGGREVSRLAFRLEPPISPATELAGSPVVLYDTPKSASDRYAAGHAGGPTSRVRLEISISGGAWTALTPAGVAHGGVVGTEHEVRIRGVHLDNAAVDSEVVSFLVYVRAPGGAASFLTAP